MTRTDGALVTAPKPNRALELTLGQNITGEHGITDQQAHAAALVVLAHATDRDDALELLATLGLIDDGDRPTP